MTDDNFLKRFIEKENYLQNPPLETKAFVKFCNEKGVVTNEKELEQLEKEQLLIPIIRIDRPVGEGEKLYFIGKDGKKYWRPAEDKLREGERETRREKIRFYSHWAFDEHSQEGLLEFFNNGSLFSPNTKAFQSWDTFRGEKLEHDDLKILTLYSSFQIYWLERTKNKPSIKAFPNKQGFDNFLRFLLSVQSVYYPYVRSGAKRITIRNDSIKWQKKRDKLNLKNEMDVLSINIEQVANWYNVFAQEAGHILGAKHDDWLQLWKNISWNKKDKLVGKIRLGIEYLQWAVMLKKVIEDHLHKEILDVDEMTNIARSNILKADLSSKKPLLSSLRTMRNKWYSDESTSYYHDTYKRLFYLANGFGFEYQPRIMVFVEGKTEEVILPKIFNYFYDKQNHLGIDFINIKGISRFFGREISLKDPQTRRYTNSFISNFNFLISYNLNKWQMIPFFVGDNEGDISQLLQNGLAISIESGGHPLPNNWKFLWGHNNKNKPFAGKDFELSNFSNTEISLAINEVAGTSFNERDIQNSRDANQGIKQLGQNVEDNKIKIAQKLLDNFTDKFIKDVTDPAFESERPFFEVVTRISDLAALNHPPVDREAEIKNREIIKELLEKGPLSS